MTRKSLAQVLVGALGLGATLLAAPSSARAEGLEACGNIDVSASAECKVEASGGCTAMCEPVRFEAACSAELYAECKGQCTAELPSCEAECSGSCEGECQANAEFDCQGSCEGRCDADCAGQCSAAANKGECEASCRATCSGECSASCEGQASASCQGKCEASCEGSCNGRARIDCQAECQASGFAECKAELEGGCEAQCTKPEGALFCDGQYVDTGDNLAQCVAALEAALNIEVQGYAEGNAECANGECTAEGEAGVSCALGGGRSPASAAAFAGLAALAGVMAARRRRRG